MNNKQDIEQTIQQTLNSLDGLRQLEPNDFLAAKAWQRMKNQHREASVAHSRLMLRLAAVLVLFVGINTASFVLLKNKPVAKPTQETSGADAFAEAYSLNNNTDSY